MPRKRPVVWFTAAAAGVAVLWLFAPGASVAPSDVVSPASRSAQADLARFESLPQREALGKMRGSIFAARSDAPEKPRPSTPVAAAAAVAPPPPAPPRMPYRVAGRVVNSEGSHVVLAKGDMVLAVRQGDIVDGDYRVAAIGPSGLTLEYLPLGTSETLAVESKLSLDSTPLRAEASPSARQAAEHKVPASIRWEGPAQVKPGDPFTVALKVSSPQPVKASPLQLSFDAKLLQPVSVRAGAFYADGIFSYRVNPAGSIFIGAAGKGASPSDAEFFYVTFKPLRPGGTAELKVSSLVLQGTDGTIAHDRPAVFRTTIVQ